MVMHQVNLCSEHFILVTMQISLLPPFIFISLLSAIISTLVFVHAHSRCLDDQKSLLLELKGELIFNSSRSSKLVKWNQRDDCCSWPGVECDGAGHVIGLQLDHEGIFGGLEDLSGLVGLGYLKKLSLANNHFNGARIPKGVGNLTRLTHLDLAYADFSGQVPVQLSHLTRLVSLDIRSIKCVDTLNLISYFDFDLIRISDIGPVAPPSLCVGFRIMKLEILDLGMLLQNLTRLRALYLDDIDLSAQKKWYDVITSSLPYLRELSMRFCDLSSPSDPYLSRFHSLNILYLDGNNLSTVAPNFFANFLSLVLLSLENCSLKGSLDLPNISFTGGLLSLVHLDLGSNSIYGSIPQSLFTLPSLKTLILSDNQLTGQISEFTTLNLKLVEIDLGYNSLSGSIPQSLFHLPSLRTLSLSGNRFSGQVGEFRSLNLSSLSWLDLRGNQLEGPIPESFFQLESLGYLDLSHNKFNGTFEPEKIQKLHNLKVFDISYNNLSVDASANSSLSTYPELFTLNMASCNLYYFPDFIKQSPNLMSLDLSNNRIAGEIPSWIWEIFDGFLVQLNLSCNLLVDLQKPYNIPSSLMILDLHSNQLHGEFLGEFSLATASLTLLSLANNSLTGSIPTSLCNAEFLDILDMSANFFTGTIPSCLLEDKFEGNFTVLRVLNLGRNNISGDIPDKFSIYCALQTLDLGSNNLEGKIPLSVANCKSLEFMNVGNNNIDDGFPCMLPSSLHVLVLRSNKFHGEVRCDYSWPNLQIIDIASNNFSGNLYSKSFSRWRGMMDQSGGYLGRNHSVLQYLSADDFYQDKVTLTIKGLELNLVHIWPDFTSIDFSCNNFQGNIPDEIGNLTSLHLLNLSHNSFTGKIPKSFGTLRQLESLDLSMNQLTGVIPVELTWLTFLSTLNLSYNKLVGEIPSGPQFRTFPWEDFEGNTGLCGPPLNISCNTHPKHENVQSHGKVEIDWDYVSPALGYVVGLSIFFWGLLCCRRLRGRFFGKIDELFEKIFNLQGRQRRNGGGRRVVRNQHVRRH